MGNTPNKRELLGGIPMDFGTEVPQKYEQLLCLPSITSPQGKEAFKFTGLFFFLVLLRLIKEITTFNSKEESPDITSPSDKGVSGYLELLKVLHSI